MNKIFKTWGKSLRNRLTQYGLSSRKRPPALDILSDRLREVRL